jgi:hypothetical protein
MCSLVRRNSCALTLTVRDFHLVDADRDIVVVLVLAHGYKRLLDALADGLHCCTA